MLRGVAWTKTGRSMQLGRACGESWARQSSKKSEAAKNEGDAACFGMFVFFISIMMIVNSITYFKKIIYN